MDEKIKKDIQESTIKQILTENDDIKNQQEEENSEKKVAVWVSPSCRSLAKLCADIENISRNEWIENLIIREAKKIHKLEIPTKKGEISK